MSTPPSYYFENGLRKVKPYYFTYKTHVKSRWIGRTVHEVFTKELGQEADITKKEISNKLIYVSSNQGMKGGPITVEGWDELKERKIQSHDLIYNTKHIHEPSVVQTLDSAILSKYPSQRLTNLKIIYESDELIVLDKPACVPTHPKGNYRFNSLTEIVKHDLQLDNVWPCHRLDKVTSGVLILGKTQNAGRKYLEIINNEKERTSKMYVARVVGEFPENEFTMNCPIFLLNTSGGYIMPNNSRNMSNNSSTIFRRLKYNNELNQSIVLCKPLTGKMHQIRIHLRNIGHPIVNDEEYNPPDGSSKRELVKRLRNEIENEMYNSIYLKYPSFKERQKEGIHGSSAELDIIAHSNFEEPEVQTKVKQLVELRLSMIKDMKEQHNKICEICERPLFDSDIDSEEQGIWLHAFRYEFNAIEPVNSFSFETTFPSWCNI